MSSEDAAELHRRAKDLFFELLDERKEDWDALLEKSCGGDDALKREVASLLANKEADTDHLMPEIDAPSGMLPPELSDALMEKLVGELGSSAGKSVPRERLTKRFEAGNLFANRYLMQSRIGVGGMGEVWLARDKMLDEEVALKFIRSRTSGDAWIQRLLRETAIARRISHRHVCRVHDAGEVDGEFFLSMEFVPGPDLAEKLRQDGRFGPDESKRLAREIVDAMVAVHATGLLHRDLKPANILLDEELAVRVSDFGLAITTDDYREDDSKSGTRAYMAPEQQRGEAPSEASDIYALGLILYETVTNRRAFRSGDEIREAAAKGELPPRPSVLASDVDAVLEHVILRCLDPEPAKRPSALELRNALTHDDALEAVLSLGDVPTAEVIASSYSRPGLTPRRAKLITALALSMLGLAALFTRFGGSSVLPERSPGDMAATARELLAEVEEDLEATNNFEYFSYESEPVDYASSGYQLRRGPRESEADFYFWYRNATAPLSPTSATNQLFNYGRVEMFDPIPFGAGMSTLLLSPTGKLLYFKAMPVLAEKADERQLPIARFFELAGLSFDEFESVTPLPALSIASTHQHAWQSPTSEVRVEVSGSGDRVLSFEVLEPVAETSEVASRVALMDILNTLLILGLFAISLPRAMRHFRSGRGDPWISLRMAMLCCCTMYIAWLCYADFPGNSLGRFLFTMVGGILCLAAANMIWVFSVAIEPSVQKRWPRTFVTWSRFFRGHLGGHRVRSDLLVGLSLGLIPTLLGAVEAWSFGAPIGEFYADTFLRDSNWLTRLAPAAELIPSAILLIFEFVAVLTVLGWILRNRTAAVIGTGLIACMLAGGGSSTTLHMFVETVAMILILISLVRYGMLAAFAAILSRNVFESFPLSHSADAWYVNSSYASMALFTLLLLCVAWPLLSKTRTPSSPLGSD